MYWVVLSCFSLFDYWTWFILSWVPFYAYLRLIILSYLVLPQTQGARLIYQSYIHPFLAHHEHDIEKFITSAHERSMAAGLEYLRNLIDFVREKVFGMQAPPRTVASPQGTYAQSLLSRFNLPNARQGLAAPAGDFYGLLSSAMGTIASTSNSREAQVDSLSRSGTLIPKELTSNAEKLSFLSAQRERFRVILTALDREASDLGTESAIERDVNARLLSESMEGLKKSKSEAEFEEIRSDGPGVEQGAVGSGGGWLPWSWGSAAGKPRDVESKKDK